MLLSYAVSMAQTSFESVGQGDWKEILKYMGLAGFKGVQLGVNSSMKIDKSELEEVLSQTNLRLVAVGPGAVYHDEGISLVDDDDRVRGAAVDRLKDLIELAADYGAIVVIGLVRGRLKEQSDPSQAFGYFKRNVIDLDSYAQRLGSDLVIEPVNRYETDYLNTAKEVIQLIEACGLRRTGILLDTFHMNIEEPSWEQSIRMASRYLKHVHIADSNRWYPGCGHINFAEIVRMLNTVGYQGFLTGEMLPKPDLKTAMTEYYNYMRNLELVTKPEPASKEACRTIEIQPIERKPSSMLHESEKRP